MLLSQCLTFSNVVPHYLNIVIPVWSAVLMPKSQCVHYLMHDSAFIVAACAYGHILGPAFTANRTETSESTSR